MSSQFTVEDKVVTLEHCLVFVAIPLSIYRPDTPVASIIVVISGSTSRSADDNTMYSASAVLIVISVCNELRQ